MTNNKYPEIDGLMIIRHEPGWIDEWAKAIDFLFDKQPKLLEKYCYYALKSKYSWLWEDSNENIRQARDFYLEEFKFYVLEYWQGQYASNNDDVSKYDPEQGLFIQYLLGSIFGCHLADKFVEENTTTANNFNLKKTKAVVASGRRKGKNEKDIKEDVEKNSVKFVSISDMNKGNDRNKDAEENGNGSDVLEDCLHRQDQCFQIIKKIAKLYIAYLNDKCKGMESSSINQVYRQAGAQLYLEMTASSLFDSPETWVYSDQKPPVCNQKGVQWIIQKTLNVIEENNPEQAPELTLYDIHQKAYQETNCLRDQKSEAAKDSITRNPAFNRQFAPISDFNDIKRLFGITSSGSARQERSRYIRNVTGWFERNKEMLRTNYDPEV